MIVILDVALLAFVAWMMSDPRRLRPHVPSDTRAAHSPRFTRDAERDPQAPVQPEPEIDYNV
jgi:hypothetical protein